MAQSDPKHLSCRNSRAGAEFTGAQGPGLLPARCRGCLRSPPRAKPAAESPRLPHFCRASKNNSAGNSLEAQTLLHKDCRDPVSLVEQTGCELARGFGSTREGDEEPLLPETENSEPQNASLARTEQSPCPGLTHRAPGGSADPTAPGPAPCPAPTSEPPAQSRSLPRTPLRRLSSKHPTSEHRPNTFPCTQIPLSCSPAPLPRPQRKLSACPQARRCRRDPGAVRGRLRGLGGSRGGAASGAQHGPSRELLPAPGTPRPSRAGPRTRPRCGLGVPARS